MLNIKMEKRVAFTFSKLNAAAILFITTSVGNIGGIF